jgi:hypothetical protein
LLCECLSNRRSTCDKIVFEENIAYELVIQHRGTHIYCISVLEGAPKDPEERGGKGVEKAGERVSGRKNSCFDLFVIFIE